MYYHSRSVNANIERLVWANMRIIPVIAALRARSLHAWSQCCYMSKVSAYMHNYWRARIHNHILVIVMLLDIDRAFPGAVAEGTYIACLLTVPKHDEVVDLRIRVCAQSLRD